MTIAPNVYTGWVLRGLHGCLNMLDRCAADGHGLNDPDRDELDRAFERVVRLRAAFAAAARPSVDEGHIPVPPPIEVMCE